MGRLSWLGGKDTPATDAASVRRARAHRRSIPAVAAASEQWEQADRRRFGKAPTFRRR